MLEVYQWSIWLPLTGDGLPHLEVIKFARYSLSFFQYDTYHERTTTTKNQERVDFQMTEKNVDNTIIVVLKAIMKLKLKCRNYVDIYSDKSS